MNLIEIHALQSFPASCLNRDETNSPKSFSFGGVNRIAISSQCRKRAIRQHSQGLLGLLFDGIRTREVEAKLREILTANGMTDAEQAAKAANEITSGMYRSDKKAVEKAKKDKKAPKKEEAPAADGTENDEDTDADTVVFVSNHELEAVAKAYVDNLTNAKAGKMGLEAVAMRASSQSADLALYGRMMASSPKLNIESSCYVNFGFTTHRGVREFDFFTAKEELSHLTESAKGGAHMGTVEMSSGVFYLYFGLDVDQLRRNLGGDKCDQAKLKEVVATVVRSVLLAVPSARQHSMASGSIPSYALALSRQGSPLQYANAFETPISSTNGLIAPSIAALKAEHEKMVAALGTPNLALEFPTSNLNEVVEKLIATI